MDVTNATDDGWKLQLQNDLPFNLQVGKIYRVSFMAKAESSRDIDVSLFGNTNLENYAFNTFSVGTTAQSYTFSYECTDSNVSTEAGFSLRFYLAHGVISDVWLDR